MTPQSQQETELACASQALDGAGQGIADAGQVPQAIQSLFVQNFMSLSVQHAYDVSCGPVSANSKNVCFLSFQQLGNFVQAPSNFLIAQRNVCQLGFLGTVPSREATPFRRQNADALSRRLAVRTYVHLILTKKGRPWGLARRP
jgi:hypothetical protein